MNTSREQLGLCAFGIRQPWPKLQLSNSLAVSLDKLLKPFCALVSSVKWANDIYLVGLCWRSEILKTYCCAWSSNLVMDMLNCYSVKGFVQGGRKTEASIVPALKLLIAHWSDKHKQKKSIYHRGRTVLLRTGISGTQRRAPEGKESWTVCKEEGG